MGASQLAVKFHESLTASIRPASLPPPILVVADPRGVNDANAFVIRLLPIGVIEETCAITKEYGRDVNFHFVDQASFQILLAIFAPPNVTSLPRAASWRDEEQFLFPRWHGNSLPWLDF